DSFARANQAAGKLDLALVLFEQALTGRKLVLPPDHPDILRTLGGLAQAYFALGKFDVALPILEAAHIQFVAKADPNEPLARMLAEKLSFARKAVDAQKRYEQARQVQGTAHLDTVLALRDVAQYQLWVGRLDEAEAALTEVLTGMAGLASDHPM